MADGCEWIVDCVVKVADHDNKVWLTITTLYAADYNIIRAVIAFTVADYVVRVADRLKSRSCYQLFRYPI